MRAADRLELDQVAARLHEYGCIDGAELQRSAMVEGLYRYVALSPSARRCLLADAVGDVRSWNMPGTGADQYPNWRAAVTPTARRSLLTRFSNEASDPLLSLLRGSVS